MTGILKHTHTHSNNASKGTGACTRIMRLHYDDRAVTQEPSSFCEYTQTREHPDLTITLTEKHILIKKSSWKKRREIGKERND